MGVVAPTGTKYAAEHQPVKLLSNLRMLIQERFGEQLCAADVEIVADPEGTPAGRLSAEGAWKQRLGVNPVVEMANSGVAGAVAALSVADLAGIDLAVRVA